MNTDEMDDVRLRTVLTNFKYSFPQYPEQHPDNSMHHADAFSKPRRLASKQKVNRMPEKQLDAHYERALLCRERAEDMMDLAFDTLRGIMSSDKASPSVRLRAALAVVKLLTAPVSAKKPYANPGENNHPEAKSENLHNSAQTAQSDPLPSGTAKVDTIRRDNPKVGRNDICRCGSGLKFKRCCLNKPLSATAAA